MNFKPYAAGALSVALSMAGFAACVGDDPANNVIAADSGIDATSDTSSSETGPGGDGSIPGDAGNPACLVDASGKFMNAIVYPFYGNAAAVKQVSDGTIYAGSFFQTATFTGDSGTLNAVDNGTDALVAKVNNNGSIAWEHAFGGDEPDSFTAMTVDEAGNIYLAGYFPSTTTTFGSTVLHASATDVLGVALKLGSDGSVKWAHGFSPGQFGFGCASIDYDNGRLVIACSAGKVQPYDLIDGGTAFLLGLEPAGASYFALDPATGGALWAHSLAASDDAGTTTAITSVDVTATTTVLAGTFSGAELLNDGVGTTAIEVPRVGNNQNGFVTEVDNGAGIPLWAKGYGDITNAGQVLSSSAAGSSATGIVVGGGIEGAVDFGSGASSNKGNIDGFVMLLQNKAGPPKWTKYFAGSGDDAVNLVRWDDCGKAVFMLQTGSSLVVDGVTLPSPQAGSQVTCIGKIDPSSTGTLLWVSGIAPGANPDTDGIDPSDFTINASEQVIEVGQFRGPVDFGNGMPITGNQWPYAVEYSP